LGGLLDGLICIGRLDASNDLWLVGRTIDVPGYQLGQFRFLRHGGSTGRKVSTFNRTSSARGRRTTDRATKRRRALRVNRLDARQPWQPASVKAPYTSPMSPAGLSSLPS